MDDFIENYEKMGVYQFELNNVSHSAGALGTNIETDTLPKKEGGSISQYRTRKQAYQNNYNLSGKTYQHRHLLRELYI